jgi:MoaA/NifB/PqqE/SkfB family radical SAM enzyme
MVAMISNESITLEVTTCCNSRCRHCFTRPRGEGGISLSLESVNKILAEGYALGYRRIHFTGGEPLLWNGLGAALDTASGMGYKELFLNTNGILLDDNISKRLGAYPGLSISVSLEGSRNQHEFLRGEGFHTLARDGIRSALAHGIEVYVFTTVTRRLLPTLARYVEQLFEEFPGVHRLSMIQLIRSTDVQSGLDEELLQPADFVSLVRMVALMNRFGHEIEILNNPLALAVSKALGIPWLPRTQPLARKGHITIMANGDITCSHSHAKPFAKYAPGRLQSVLQSAPYKEAVARDKSTCPQCKYTLACQSEGMLRPSKWYRDMVQQAPFCKRVMDLACGRGDKVNGKSLPP